MKDRIISLLLADTRQLRFIAGYASLVFAVGLAFATQHSGAYNMMREYAPLALWGVWFGVYGWLRVISAVRPLSTFLESVAILLGITLWVFTLVSFAQNPDRKFGVGDMMLSTLVLIEVLIAAASMSNRKH